MSKQEEEKKNPIKVRNCYQDSLLLKRFLMTEFEMAK